MTVTHDDLVAWATYTVVMHQPQPEDDRGLIAWTIGRVVLVAVLVVLGAWAGYTLGLRDHREERRTRTAVCQVLDQLGADASTAAQAYPCRDTPAPGPGR